MQTLTARRGYLNDCSFDVGDLIDGELNSTSSLKPFASHNLAPLNIASGPLEGCALSTLFRHMALSHGLCRGFVLKALLRSFTQKKKAQDEYSKCFSK